jgi:uncharacterized protein (DUF2267 family)
VSGTIVRHVNNGEARQVAHLLPEEIRSLWPVQ